MDIRRPDPPFFSPYPDLVRDFSFIGHKDNRYGELQEALIADYRPLALLVEINLADVYPNPLRPQTENLRIPDDMVSYLVEMRWEPQLSTLSQSDIVKITDQVIQNAKRVNFELRSE